LRRYDRPGGRVAGGHAGDHRVRRDRRHRHLVRARLLPAVFGVTDQAYIAFTANAFALPGLRALFFLVTGLLDG
jgi:hypothetical protein